MSQIQFEGLYDPGVFDDSAKHAEGWQEAASAPPTWSILQRVVHEVVGGASSADPVIRVTPAARDLLVPMTLLPAEPVQVLGPSYVAVSTPSLIDKALRDRCKRRVGADGQSEQSGEPRGPGLRNALAQHMQNQFIAITAHSDQMFDDPDVRNVARGLVERLRVLLDEPEQVLATPARLRSAVQHQVLEEPMFSENEVAAFSHGRLDIADIRSRRADSMLLALPTESGVLYPRFQFDEDGAVNEMAQRVNQHLRAADDPWGVASWWFAEHIRLRGRPADLLDTADAVGSGGASSDDEALRRADALFAVAQAMTDPVA